MNGDEPVIELRSRVPPDAHGMLLVDYLARRFPYLDRQRWSDEIRAGRLWLDGRIATGSQTVRKAAALVYRKPHREPEVDRRVQLVHTDADFVVVDKPAHLPVHADGPFVQNTLVHIVRTMLHDEALQLVHRLDRETSGLCLLARTAHVRDALRTQFAAGTIGKTYVAVVRGRAETDFTIDRPIGNAAHSEIALRRSAAADARDPKPAYTQVVVLRRGPERSLVRCLPRTGRTHQIRVHLEAVGFPVLGDKLYGRPDADYLAFVHRVKAGAAPSEVPPGEPGRHLLHAAALAFVHPRTGESVAFTAPQPADFAPWLVDTEPVEA